MHPILVYPYHEAPPELQISTNGGDEDWLAEVPPDYEDYWISWLDSGTAFGVCDVLTYDHPTKPGWIIRIGSHA